jgi:hypothetical protein
MRRRDVTASRRRAGSCAADRIWIGFLHFVAVRPDSVLDGGDGAYGYLAARVPDQARYLRVVGRAATRHGLVLENVEWVEPATALPPEHRPGGELQELVGSARRSPRPVVWGPLHAYTGAEGDESDDEDVPWSSRDVSG